MPLPVIAGAALAVAAVGTAASIHEQKKAAKQAKIANRFERQKSDLQSARQETQAIREARQTYARSQQAAENQGVADSSVAEGSSGSIVSQLNSNLSFLDQYGFYSDQASKALGKAASAQATAGMWGDVAGLAEKAYGYTGGISK